MNDRNVDTKLQLPVLTSRQENRFSPIPDQERMNISNYRVSSLIKTKKSLLEFII